MVTMSKRRSFKRNNNKSEPRRSFNRVIVDAFSKAFGNKAEAENKRKEQEEREVLSLSQRAAPKNRDLSKERVIITAKRKIPVFTIRRRNVIIPTV